MGRALDASGDRPRVAGIGNDDDREYDVITDYFRPPRPVNKPHHAYETVMHVLNNAIGVFEARKKRAFWEMFNPVTWAAFFIRLPITIMERAGFGGNRKSQELLVGAYATFVKAVMAAILVLVLVKLGVTIPWDEIVKAAVRFFLK